MIVKDWEAHGFRCLVRLINDRSDDEFKTSHYCGYVVIPDGHPVYEKPLHQYKCLAVKEPSVHGGITWTGYPQGLGDINEKLWLVGFDCYHAGDCPLFREPRMMPWNEMEHKWTQEEVEQETERLAEQLKEMWK